MITWVNGKKEELPGELPGELFHEQGECLMAKLHKDADPKKRFSSRNCTSPPFKNKDVICEKQKSKHVCTSDKNCHELAACVEGRCLCDRGFAGDGHHCFDVDECRWFDSDDNKENLHICSHGQCCYNTIGSYDCSPCHASNCHTGPFDNCNSHCDYTRGGIECLRECSKISSCASKCIQQTEV